MYRDGEGAQRRGGGGVFKTLTKYTTAYILLHCTYAHNTLPRLIVYSSQKMYILFTLFLLIHMQKLLYHKPLTQQIGRDRQEASEYKHLQSCSVSITE